jgi:hypothetical protein
MPVISDAAGTSKGLSGATAIHAVGRQLRQFDKGRAGIDQRIDALARQQLAARQMFLARAFRTTEGDARDGRAQIGNDRAHGLGVGLEIGAPRVELGLQYRHQKPPEVSQRSICGSRSTPKNGSPSTIMYGEPKTPAASAASHSPFRRCLSAGRRALRTESRGRHRAARPVQAPRRGRRRRAPRNVERAKKRVRESPRRCAVLIVQPVVGARRVLRGERKLHRMRVGTPRKRAEREKSCTEYSPLSGTSVKWRRAGVLEHHAEQNRPPPDLAPVARGQFVDLLGGRNRSRWVPA